MNTVNSLCQYNVSITQKAVDLMVNYIANKTKS